MSRPQAHLESQSSGFLDELVTFVVNVVEVARVWISSWYPSVPTSGTTQVKDVLKQASVAPPQRDDPSTSPNVPSGPVEVPNPLSVVGRSGNKEDSFVLQENQLSYPTTRDLDDTTIAAKVEELRDEVPLVQDQDLEQAKPTANTHEITVANDLSKEWVSLSKPDVGSPSIKASEEVPTPSQPEDLQAEDSPPQQQEATEPTLVDASTLPHESTTGSDTSSLPLSTPEPDTHSFDNAAIRIQTDAEGQAPLNPESNVESGSVGEILKARTSTPSLNDSASNSNTQGLTSGTSEPPTKKQRGGSFIKRQTTLMNKVFKSGNGKDAVTNLTSPSKASLTTDNQSMNSSLVSEPEAMEHSNPASDLSLADTSIDKKITSPSRVSLRTIGSIKKKFGRRGSTASDKDVGAPEQESRPGTPESLSSTSQPSKVADATGPSLLKTMFKVRKPLKVDELRT